jgi:myo-inositol 2-dehydrogenase/D-chiro-inositol 1-dehydrogenase
VIGVALIGAGGFGSRLGRAIQNVPGLRLVAILDASPAQAADAARDLGVPALGDLDDVLARDDVDAVVIATPHGAHVAVGLAAVAAGRHVFVEKPISLTVAEGRALVDAAAAARLTLLVGHVTRLLPVAREAIRRLDEGCVGRPAAVAMVRHQDLPRRGWRARRADYGMLLHSPAVHNLDLMNRILGRATSVTALAAPPIQSALDYPDTIAMLVDYESGAVGSLNASVSDRLGRPEGTNTVRVLGDRGSLAFDIASGDLVLQPADSQVETVRLPAGPGDIDDALLDELGNFRDSIAGDAEPFVSPDAALAAVELCEAADRSIAARGTVRLPLTTPTAGRAA